MPTPDEEPELDLDADRHVPPPMFDGGSYRWTIGLVVHDGSRWQRPRIAGALVDAEAFHPREHGLEQLSLED